MATLFLSLCHLFALLEVLLLLGHPSFAVVASVVGDATADDCTLDCLSAGIARFWFKKHNDD